MDEVFDLFGDPVRPYNPKGGRPAHIATQENRDKVSLLLAFGWSNERIAQALHVCLPTLRSRYFSELRARDQMRDRLDAALAMRMWREAQTGNVGAARLFVQLVDRNDLRVLGGPQRRAEPKPPKLGKKEAAALEAQTPDTETPLGRLMATRLH
jgi:hypothetical protein